MAMTLTSEVALIMLMSWLPVGGTIERIACGMMMRRSARARVMPNASAASVWPRIDREQAAADDLRHVGGLVEREADDGRGHRRDQIVGVPARQCRAEGNRRWRSAATGSKVVPEHQLDQQRRAAEEPDVQPAGECAQPVSDRRAIASRSPTTMPTTIATTVSSEGDRRCPLRIWAVTMRDDGPLELLVVGDDPGELRRETSRTRPRGPRPRSGCGVRAAPATSTVGSRWSVTVISPLPGEVDAGLDQVVLKAPLCHDLR